MTDEPLIIDTKFHVIVNGVIMYCLGVALTLSILGYIGESYVWLGFPGDITGSITMVKK